MYRILSAIGLVTALATFPVNAAFVTELQMPAWLERDGQRAALQAGFELRDRDTVETGEQGRLGVLFRDGSLLKAGGNTRLSVHELRLLDDTPRLFRAVVDVSHGSFRLLAGGTILPLERDITVRLNSTVVNVRHAELCGRSGHKDQVVCLIRGTLNVQHPSTGRFVMDTPGTVFRAPTTGQPGPITPADPELLAAWAAATEIVPGGGLILPDGGWIVQLASQLNEDAARQLAQRLRQAGYAAEVTRLELKGRAHYRVRIAGFDSKSEAHGFAARISGQVGMAKPWLTCISAECKQ